MAEYSVSTVEITDKSAIALIQKIIKNSKNIDEKSEKYVGLLSAIVFQDLIDHFEKEAGPNGRWPAWGPKYAAIMAKKGKSGNKLLQDSGTLKGGWAPANYRTVSDGIVWFNRVRYGKRHNEGIGVKKRQFAWLSGFAIEKLEKQTLDFLKDV